MATPFLLLVFIIPSALALPKIRPGSNGVHVGVNVVLGSAEDIKSAAANTSHALKVGNKGGSRNAELEKAIQNRDVQKAKHTINSGEDVNAYDRRDGCPFKPGEFVTVHPKFKYEWLDHTVSKFPYDNPELVQKLIEQGADVNCLGPGGWTPLITAVGSNYHAFADNVGCHGSTHVPMQPNRLKVIKLLVEAGADIDHQTDIDHHGWNALLEATRVVCWNVEAIKLFVSSGANVNIKTSPRMLTPLIMASQGFTEDGYPPGYDPANLEIVKLLVSKGAEVNAIECGNCETPLDAAIRTKEYAVAEYLKKHGGVQIAGHCPDNIPPCPDVHPARLLLDRPE